MTSITTTKVVSGPLGFKTMLARDREILIVKSRGAKTLECGPAAFISRSGSKFMIVFEVNFSERCGGKPAARVVVGGSSRSAAFKFDYIESSAPLLMGLQLLRSILRERGPYSAGIARTLGDGWATFAAKAHDRFVKETAKGNIFPPECNKVFKASS